MTANTVTLVQPMLTPDMVYLILDELYEGQVNDPDAVMEVITQLEYHLVELGLPIDREDYEDGSYLDHPENEQYKRLTYWLDADKNERQ